MHMFDREGFSFWSVTGRWLPHPDLLLKGRVRPWPAMLPASLPRMGDKNVGEHRTMETTAAYRENTSR